jgi:hypothetical protein
MIFQTRVQQPVPMLHLLVKFSPSYSSIIFFIGTYPLLVSCRGNFGESNCGEFFSSSWFNSNLTKDSTIFSSTKSLSFTKKSSSFSSARHTRAFHWAWQASFSHSGS